MRNHRTRGCTQSPVPEPGVRRGNARYIVGPGQGGPDGETANAQYASTDKCDKVASMTTSQKVAPHKVLTATTFPEVTLQRSGDDYFPKRDPTQSSAGGFPGFVTPNKVVEK